MLRRYENTGTFIATSTFLGAGFLLGGLAHLLGWLPVEESSRMYMSGILEVLCGALLFGAAFSLRTHRPNGWRNALGANAIALVLLAVGMLFVSPVLRVSTLSLLFHAVMLLLLVFNTVGLWRMRPRNPIKRAIHETAARLY